MAHHSQRVRSIAQCLYRTFPDDEGDLKEIPGADKHIYSSIHVLIWAPKPDPVSSVRARTPVLLLGATCLHKLPLVKAGTGARECLRSTSVFSGTG